MKYFNPTEVFILELDRGKPSRNGEIPVVEVRDILPGGVDLKERRRRKSFSSYIMMELQVTVLEVKDSI